MKVYFPTNTHGFEPVGFLDEESAQKWIDEYVLKEYRHQWRVITETVYANYDEYKKATS